MKRGRDLGRCLGFQIKHIGDFLHTLPALGFLKDHCPGGAPDLVISPKMADLARAHPWVNHCLILDRQKGWGHFRQVISEMRGRGYSSSFVFDGQDRSIAAAFLGGVKKRIGATGLYPLRGWRRFLYTDDVEIRDCRGWPLASQAQRAVMTAAVALGLEIPPAPRPPRPVLGPENLVKAEELIGELPGSGPLIGLTLQGLQPEKSWPLANFRTLAKKLYEEFSARLFVTGGPDESLAAQVLAERAGVPVGNFCGRTDLLDLVALADKSDLFITVDTGTSHLVALTETPLVSIFIWTSPALWPPQTPHLRILCYDWALARFGLKAEDGPWFSSPVVTPELVFVEAASLLGFA